MNLLQLAKQTKKTAKKLHGDEFNFISLNISCIDMECDGEEDYKVKYCASVYLKNNRSYYVESADYKQLQQLLKLEYSRQKAEVADITL